jgi:hypothetical protein
MRFRHNTVDFRMFCLHGDLGMQNCLLWYGKGEGFVFVLKDSDPKGQKQLDPGHCFYTFFTFCLVANCDSQNN